MHIDLHFVKMNKETIEDLEKLMVSLTMFLSR